MKRVKSEIYSGRRFKFSHFLLGLGGLYLIFIVFKFLYFLEISSVLSGDDSYDGLDGKVVVDVSDADLSKPSVNPVYKDMFHRKLEDKLIQDAPMRPTEEPFEEGKGEVQRIKPLQHLYGRITGEIMRRMNKTSELSLLERMADEAWTLGLKAWEEVDDVDGKEIGQSSLSEGKPKSCPSWLSVKGEDLTSGDRLMFLPCGLKAGSSITVVGTPRYAHQEYVPKLAKLRIGNGLVMVSQFMVELQGCSL